MEDDLRRVFTVAEEGIVGGMLPAGPPGSMWIYLVRHPGDGDFRRVSGLHPVQPGDEVVACLLDPARLDVVERLNGLYSAAWYTRDDWYDEPWDDESAAFAAWVPKSGAVVLETCCGGGRATRGLVREGNHVVGLDMSVPPLTRGKATRPEIGWVRGDALALPFADATFDAVLCLENSLGEFLSDPVSPAAEMIRVCKAGGRVIVALRDAPDPRIAWAPEGYVHVVRTFPELRRDWFLDVLRQLPRVGEIERWPGHERPWGGRVWHVALSIT